MTQWVFQPESATALSVAESDRLFPVRRVYCVGRNYAEHAREMGESTREAPFFFTKPANSIVSVPENREGLVSYPPRTEDLHHEVELVVALGAGGSNLNLEQAEKAIWGYAVGVDLTRRDLQAAAKEKGRPWDVAKGFDQAAPIGSLYPRGETGPLENGHISLEVNGTRRQQGDLADMIWSAAECIVELSTYFELKAGDILMTGTPAGVAALQKGDHVLASIQRIGQLSFRVQ
ncbi:MAG TPA: fumarylacetoacetate hydrolase family protein [Paenalcaligenes sp.]|nr:fumarylacetoacetate hydrolase family protein [Paenalcaligenes sp.]